MAVAGSSPRSWNETPGTPKKMSDVRRGMIWLICSCRIVETAASVSLTLSSVLVDTTVIASSTIASCAHTSRTSRTSCVVPFRVDPS